MNPDNSYMHSNTNLAPQWSEFVYVYLRDDYQSFNLLVISNA